MTNLMNGLDLKMEKIEELGWSIQKLQDGEYMLSKFSPAGQDFNIEIEIDERNPDSMSDVIFEVYDGFDVSYETYLWLDQTGHGKNGAPYDMKDLYEDMEACQDMILDLSEALDW